MPKPESKQTVREEEILRIGIVLIGEMVEKFESLKQRYGIRSNSDLMRFLVSDKYEQIGAPTPLVSR